MYDPIGRLLAPNEPLSAAFWHEVTEQIFANQTIFETYTDLRTKKFQPYSPVTGSARYLTLCGLRSMSVPIFEQCSGSMAITTSFF
jgi:sphingomyelin phosphodiesterase